MNRLVVSSLVVAAAMALLASPASAQDRPKPRATANKVTLGVAVGYGFRVTDEGNLDSDANPYGVGLGLRAGYTLDAGIYLGALSQFFAGTRVGNDTVSGRIYQMNLAAEVGYDLKLGDNLVLRPSVAIGSTVSLGERCVLGRCTSDHTDPFLLVAPAATLIVSMGKVYVAAEARYFYLPDDAIPDGLLLGGNVGVLL